ncbi:MAG TPA: hypothetical protein VN829_00045, partial [Dongiaceae bacterium]|nr:hypothetical protein [Dongiaceae bacterium]
AALVPAFQASAQYKPTGDDGITASPRVRKALSERPMGCASGFASADRKNSKVAAGDGLAASPKVRARLEELKRSTLAAASPAAVLESSTTRAPNDRIAASPKVRERMREWPAQPQVEIAPIVPAK